MHTLCSYRELVALLEIFNVFLNVRSLSCKLLKLLSSRQITLKKRVNMSTTVKLKSYKMRILEAGKIPYTLQKMCQFEVDLLYFSNLKY